MFEAVFLKEKEIWEMFYYGVELTVKKVGKKYIVGFKIGKFNKYFETWDNDEKMLKKFEALRESFKRIAIFNFIKQNK